MTTNKSKSTINNAAVYFVNELRPAYDICYKLTSEPIELMDDLTGLDKKSTESILKKFIKKREDFNKRNQKARDVLDIKKETFEKLKFEMDGWTLKELDNEINNVLQQLKIKLF